MKLSFSEFLTLLFIGLIVATISISSLFLIIEWAHTNLKLQ